jgi:hypothetical protein
MKTKDYTQVSLLKGETCVTVFIPSEFAIQGQVLKVCHKGIWDDGWVVDVVWPQKVASVPDVRKSIRRHRERTGDSLPCI